jgi:hypothetical protein
MMPIITVLAIMFMIGAFCILFPSIVHKYDTRMTRIIKNETEYKFTVRVFGIIFLLISLLVGGLFLELSYFYP